MDTVFCCITYQVRAKVNEQFIVNKNRRTESYALTPLLPGLRAMLALTEGSGIPFAVAVPRKKSSIPMAILTFLSPCRNPLNNIFLHKNIENYYRNYRQDQAGQG